MPATNYKETNMKTPRISVTLTALVLALAAFASVSACAQDSGSAAPAAPEAAAAPAGEASQAVLENDDARASYAIGLQLGESLKRSGLQVDTPALFTAIEDSLKGRTPALNEEQMMTAMKSLQERMMQKLQSQSDDNLKKAEEFLAKNATEPGVVKTDSGLQYVIVTPGDGEKPTGASKVRVHYKGTLLDGTEFDSSYKRNEPAEFQVNQVIKGWTEALQLMPVGAKYKLFIPPALGYGAQGNQRIPGNSLLLFEVELLEILPAAPAAEQSTLIQ